jgi:hypothetical protein
MAVSAFYRRRELNSLRRQTDEKKMFNNIFCF